MLTRTLRSLNRNNNVVRKRLMCSERKYKNNRKKSEHDDEDNIFDTIMNGNQLIGGIVGGSIGFSCGLDDINSPYHACSTPVNDGFAVASCTLLGGIIGMMLSPTIPIAVPYIVFAYIVKMLSKYS